MSDAGHTPPNDDAVDDDPGRDDPAPVTADAAPADAAPADTATDADRTPADLDAIGRDLAGVEAALSRLDDGSYWTDEVTGEPIPDEVLAADPVARRAGTE